MKSEHVVLCLRMMARLVRKSSQEDLDNIAKMVEYKALLERAMVAVNQLNEYEVLDFLFWMRKFRTAKVPLLLTPESLEKFHLKI